MAVFEHVNTGERINSTGDSMTAVLLSSPSWKEVKELEDKGAVKSVVKKGRSRGSK